MDRALGEYGALALSHDPAAALVAVEAHIAEYGPSDAAAAVLAFVQVLNCQFDAAVLSLPEADDPLSRAIDDFVTAVCLAEIPDVHPVGEASADLRGLHAFVTVEAAMSAGQIARAETVARGVAPGLTTLAGGTYWAWNQVALARSLVFQGRVEEALAVIGQVLDDPRARQWPAVDRIARGVRAFVAAQGGDPDPGEVYAGSLVEELPDPRTYLESAAFVLAAFADQAAGRLDRVKHLLLHGAGGVFLQRFQVVDRLYAYEMLIEAAVAAGDLPAAEEWLDRAEVLPVDAHDMASAALGLCRARVALARNDPETGARESVRSSARAALVGGDREAHRGLQLRDWAVRELGLQGRRLRNVPGLGWESLTDRQQRVALLAAQGLRNREIGARLFVSERTVEGHISAVLDALGAPSRVGIGRHVPRGPTGFLVGGHDLTPRQRDVANLVAQGRSNAEIGGALGISEKTVEKHLKDLFDRLGVQSRTAVAAAVRDEAG